MATYYKVNLITLTCIIGIMVLFNLVIIDKARVRRNVEGLLPADSENGTIDLSLNFDNDTSMDEMIEMSEREMSNSSGLGSSENLNGTADSVNEENLNSEPRKNVTREDDLLKIALMSLQMSRPTRNASEIAHLGIFKQNFGPTNIWSHHIKIIIPYDLKIYLEPLNQLERLLNETIIKVSELTRIWKKEDLANNNTEFGGFTHKKQSEVCRGIKFKKNSPNYISVCKPWSLSQFSRYLIRELKSLHRAAIGHLNTVRRKVLKLEKTFQGVKIHEDGVKTVEVPKQEITRDKRGLYVVGRLEKQLFGIATLEDINVISASLGEVIETQDGIIMAADYSTAILKSHTKHIVSVASAVVQLQTLVINVTENIKKDIGEDMLITKMLTNNLYTQSASNIYIRTSLILQDLDANIRITSTGLNQALLGRFTMSVMDPEELMILLQEWENKIFKNGEQFLWPKEDTEDVLQYYGHSRIKLLNSRKTSTPIIDLSIPTTRQEELLTHYKIITTPYKSYMNESTYRIFTGIEQNPVDILIRERDIFLADKRHFEYHPNNGIDMYTTNKLVKLTGEKYECMKAIIDEEISGIMENCKLRVSDIKLETYQVTKERYLIYSEEMTQIAIECLQPKQNENHFNRTLESIYLAELTVPDICSVKVGDTTFLGEPITLMARRWKSKNEFKLEVQNFDSFDPNMWISILENLNKIEERTVDRLIHDLKSFTLEISGMEGNETQILLKQLSEKLIETRLQNNYASQLFRLVHDPWILSFSTMAMIILFMAILLFCVIKRLYCKQRQVYKYQNIESFELVPESMDTESLRTLISTRLNQEMTLESEL